MRSLQRTVLALCVSGLVALAAQAQSTQPATVDLKGTVVCAKCSLKVDGQKDCQNVLVVKDGETETRYYLVKNDVYKKYGEVCHARKDATVTGTVEEKDGQKWLTATKIESAKS